MAQPVYKLPAQFIVGSALLLLSVAVVQPRSVTGSSRWLALSPDTYQYLAMVRGDPTHNPYAARVLVPRLAALLPLEPLEAIGAITYAALLISYVLLLRIMARLRVQFLPACVALVTLATSTRQLLMVQNPYLTDGFSFLMMTMMLGFFLADRAVLFGLTTFVGGLAREDCLYGAAGFLATRRWRSGLLIVVTAALSYLLPRWRTRMPGVAFLGFGQFATWQFYAETYFALGFLWPLTVLALPLTWSSGCGRIVPYFGLVLAGSLVSILFASDTTRMFLPILPVAVVLWGLMFQRLRNDYRLLALWIVSAALNLVLSLPTILFPAGAQITHLEEWYYRLAGPLFVYHVSGLVLVAASMRLAKMRPATNSGLA
jgi:hypothetical protein